MTLEDIRKEIYELLLDINECDESKDGVEYAKFKLNEIAFEISNSS
jgi:hypothetical protein